MRVLVSTYYFAPSIGGIETACLTLSEGLARRGHDVTVVTLTPAAGHVDDYPFAVVRCPSLLAQMNLMHRHDVLWQNGVCLRLAGLFASTTPKIFAHHGALKHAGLKRLVCASGTNVFVSRALQDVIGLPGMIIPNSYDEDTFRRIADERRELDFAFVGRLAEEKGADILLDALSRLAAGGRRFSATIVGQGPEEARLKAQAAGAGLSALVTFPGLVRGEALARLLNRHRVLVVPSRWETFGIAALEGAACGCVVAGTDAGGLPDAIGPAGPVVPSEDPSALARELGRLIAEPAYADAFRDRAAAHLGRFTRKRLIDMSEALIAEVVAGGAGAWLGKHGPAAPMGGKD